MADFFAEVILPLPLGESYTYRVPEGLEPQALPGRRVVVSFGKKKSYSALITAVHSVPPIGYDIKEIESVLDDHPVIYEINLELWQWIARYYICLTGEVMKAALPSGLKLESTTIISLNPGGLKKDFSSGELAHIQYIGDKERSIRELEKALGKNFSFRILKQLINDKIIRVEETIKERYRPKIRAMIALHPEINSTEKWDEAYISLNKAKKQKELMSYIAQVLALFTPEQKNEISKKELTGAGIFSEAILNQLISKNILTISYEPVSRLPLLHDEQISINLLNEPQQQALTEIKEQFRQKQVVLLHGITASGKTEIYIHLMDEACRQGKQVLYLVPEIALTPQIVARLNRVFGPKVGVYHSKMSDSERVETWNSVLSFSSNPEHPCQIILGTRSAVFLPFSRLGIIIVDEEHDSSFKQTDPSPRYNARDMAVVLGLQHKAPVLLGSATPSYESFHNAKTGKYGLVSLLRKFGSAELPVLVVADIKKAWKRREMRSFLTPELFSGINEALKSDKQVILFQNRRGYSPFVECMECGHIIVCANCDVSLTVHKNPPHLVCHYCGYTLDMPECCPECGSKDIKSRGFGTEKVEDEISGLFPSARIARMDLDSTHSKTAFEKIIRQLEQWKIDILIGTQMVTKGLDIENISLVGILNADNLLNYPDFREYERAFQLMHQVSGRAGRKENRGSVVIQTTHPEHPVIHYIKEHDYEGLFNELMIERKFFHYPPWFRLIRIVVKHKNVMQLDLSARQLAEMLRETGYFRVLGPEAPVVGRIQQWLIREIWLKTPRNQKLSDIQDAIKESIDKIRHTSGNSGLIIQVDVDPL